MRSFVLSGIFVSVVLLAGCGGGGSGSNPDNSTAATGIHAEGLYLQTNTVRIQKSNFIIKDEFIFGISGSTDSDGQMLYADGVSSGFGSSKNGTYSASMNYYSDKDYVSTLSASDGKVNYLNGTLTTGSVSQPFEANSPSTAAYNYDNAASIDDVSGAWIVNGSTNFTVNKIDSRGGFISGSYFPLLTAGPCTFSGTIIPDTKKNVYFITITDSRTAACGVSGGLVSRGFAASYLLQNGKRQLLIMTQTSGVNLSRGFAGVR